MKIRYLGLVDYCTTLRAMQQFTSQRTDETEDELWILEHPPTFTQGQAGKPEHILQKSDIPIVQVDRGGQVTYHAPGQLIIYTLINFKRRKIGIRFLVEGLERAIITTLNHYGIDAQGRRDAPGVYVDGKKIASLGLRIKNGATYHGLSLNIDMDLTPFSYINPCGHQGLEMTQMADLINSPPTIESVANILIHHLQKNIGL